MITPRQCSNRLPTKLRRQITEAIHKKNVISAYQLASDYVVEILDQNQYKLEEFNHGNFIQEVINYCECKTMI